MAKIRKKDIYLPKTTVVAADYWPGTDTEDSNKTKSFSAEAIKNYVALELGIGTEQNNIVTEKALGVIDISVANAFVTALNALDNYTVAANEIVAYTGEFLENGKPVNVKFIYVLQTGKGTYGVGGTQLTIDDVVLFNPVQPQTDRNTTIINGLVKEDEILSGNIVWRESTLIFDTLNFSFLINNDLYIPVNQVLTLSDADATNPRIDVFAADSITGTIIVIEGTPAVTPEEPSIDFGLQIRISSVYIPALATEPQVDPVTNFVIDLISDELDTEPTEWNLISTPTNTNVSDTVTPYKGTKSINVASDAVGVLKWQKDTFVTYDPDGYLQFGLKLSQPMVNGQIGGVGATGTYVKIILRNEADGSGSTLFASIAVFTLAGFDNNSTDWQAISIPMVRFNYIVNNVPGTFNSFSLEFIRFGQVSIDDIKIQVGITNPSGVSNQLSIRNENNVEQFITEDFIQFENVNFDSANKRITVLGGSFDPTSNQDITGNWTFEGSTDLLLKNDKGLRFSNTSNAFTSTIRATNITGASSLLELPSASGIIPVSVNGQVADVNGNITFSFEGYNETGTRAGGDLIVTLGDYDDSGGSTKVVIDDANSEVVSNIYRANSLFILDSGGSLRIQNPLGGFSSNIRATGTGTGSSFFDLPNVPSGVFIIPISVNGNLPDATGNITVPTGSFDPSSNQTISGNWEFSTLLSLDGGADMSLTKLTNLANGTNSGDGINKGQLDAVVIGNGAGVSPTSRTTVGGETDWTPIPGTNITNTHQLFSNGSKLEEGIDYTVSTDTFTFDASYLPIAVEKQTYYPHVSVVANMDTTNNSIIGDSQTATGDGTTTIDWSLGNTFDFQFGAFNEVFTFTNPSKAGTFILKLVQDSVGSRTATFPASVKWSGGTAPTLTTTATTGTDIITFYFDGTDYFGVEVLNFS